MGTEAGFEFGEAYHKVLKLYLSGSCMLKTEAIEISLKLFEEKVDLSFNAHTDSWL